MTSNSKTRSQLALRSELTYTGVTFLLVGLPLVMFILPGNIPLSARRLLKQRRSWWRNRQSDAHQSESHRSDSQ